MELRHLKLIDVVANEGTLSKAAEKLHLSQSALSHQLREIEEELGTLMFDRVSKRLVISRSGKIIRRAAINIRKELELAKNEIKKELEGSKGEIRLSTECYTCYHWLPQVLKNMEVAYQQIDVHILPEFTKKHFEGLLSNEIDLVITSLQTSDPNIAYKELFSDELLLISSHDHPFATKPFVSPGDFKTETLIIYSRPIEESTFYNMVLKPEGILPEKFLEIRLTEAAIQLIKGNLGVKVMARWAAEHYIRNGEVNATQIGPKGIYRKWYLAYNKSMGWKKQYDHFKKYMIDNLNKHLLENL